jgi:hypothetical protein
MLSGDNQMQRKNGPECVRRRAILQLALEEGTPPQRKRQGR